MMRKALDLTGQKYGMLIAVKKIGADMHGKIRWLFNCDCGKEHIANGSEVKQGKIRSCGCIKAEIARQNGRKYGGLKPKHGMCNAPEYAVWKTMRQRCNNPNCEDYELYGGKGIKVCERWDSFESFYSDMGPRPNNKMSIDRERNDGDYEPGNCRWTDAVTQANNRNRRRTKKELQECLSR